MKDNISIVTGANSGIGKVTAQALADKGATVLMVCRNERKGDAALREIKEKSKNDNVQLLLADLSSQEEIRNLVDEIRSKCPKIDVLVNNAGGINPKRTLTVDGIETTFAVNHLGYFLLTNLLLDQLRAAPAARVVNVSSEVHRYATVCFDDLGLERSYTPMKAYCQSKLANILFTHELGGKLRGTNVTVNVLHPGSVRTNFGKNLSGIFGFYFKAFGPLMRSPAKGAETVIWLATSSDVDGVTGRYFFDKKGIRSSKISYDTGVARRLWEASARLTGLERS